MPPLAASVPVKIYQSNSNLFALVFYPIQTTRNLQLHNDTLSHILYTKRDQVIFMEQTRQMQQAGQITTGNQMQMMNQATPGNQMQQASQTTPRNQMQQANQTDAGNQVKMANQTITDKQMKQTSQIQQGNQMQQMNFTQQGNQMQMTGQNHARQENQMWQNPHMQQDHQMQQANHMYQGNQIQQANHIYQGNQMQQANHMYQGNQMRQDNQNLQDRQIQQDQSPFLNQIPQEQLHHMQQTENTAGFSAPNRNVIRVFSALVEEVSRDRGTTFVTISYRNCDGCAAPSDTVRLVVSRDTDIFNEQGQRIRAGELERGMTVDASFSSAMTRSIPPQAQAFFIRITARAPRTEITTGRIAQVNPRGHFLLVMRNQNPASAIQFHINQDTAILDVFGRRTNLSALRPGFRVRVEHAPFMTASIPPQTTAFVVQIIR